MPHLICEICNKEFTPKDGRIRKDTKYCSNICKGISARTRTRYEMPCLMCGKMVSRLLSSQPEKFICSSECLGKYNTQRTTVTRQCVSCGKEFTCRRRSTQKKCARTCGQLKMLDVICEYCGNGYKTSERDKSSRFCSQKCKNKASWITKTCEECGGEYRIKISHAENSKYCSTACMSEAYRVKLLGSNNPNYGGGTRGSTRRCMECGTEYESYNKKRRFCSRDCANISNKRAEMRGDKIDANQPEIVSALRSVGVTVISLAGVKFGCPDLAAGYRGSTFLLEVKTENGRMTPQQEEFFPSWKGHAAIVRNPQEAYNAIGISASYMGGGSGILL